jgi:hypothetical protein
MKKIFLIPLMTLLTCVMAWGGVAKIGTTEYETLNAAFEAAQNDDQIDLLEDVTVSTVIGINSKNVTLHMHGHKITNNVSFNRAFRIYDATFTIVGNADGISANASMEIPDSNIGSFGFIDFRSTSNATTGKERLVVYNVDFEGATTAGAFFMFRADGQSIKLQDVNVICDKGINTGVAQANATKFTNIDRAVGENLSIVNGYNRDVTVEIIRGTYTYDSYNTSAGVFQAGVYEEDNWSYNDPTIVVFNGVTVNTTCGPILEAHGKVTYTNCQFNIVDPNNIHAYLQTSAAVALVGDLTVNSGNYVGKYAAYVWNSGGTININGGNFVSNVQGGAALCADAATKGDAIINVYGGNFDGAIKAGTNGTAKAEVNIVGGNFSNASFQKKGEASSINITGGTFSGTAITAESLANYVDTENGYIITPNTDGSFTVKKQQSTDATDVAWTTATDWSDNTVPSASSEVTVNENVTVTVGDGTEEVAAEAQSIDLAAGSTLIVKENATLMVGKGGIAGTGSVKVEEGGQLLISPLTDAPVQPYGTVTYKAVHARKVPGAFTGEGYCWEHIALPTIGYPVDLHSDAPSYTTYLNAWNLNTGWVELTNFHDQFTENFKGYSLTNNSPDGNVTYTFTGTLVGNVDQTMNFSAEGFTYFANSYTGPIDITSLLIKFETGSEVQRAVYVWNPEQEHYMSITTRNVGRTIGYDTYPSEIKPMQAFFIFSHDAASQEISYESAVWAPMIAGGYAAPSRERSVNNDMVLTIVSENGRHDNLVLSATTSANDNEILKLKNPATSVNLYALSENGDMSYLAENDFNTIYLGFTTNRSTSYTIEFSGLTNGEYELYDMVENRSVAIVEGASYEFTENSNSTVENRFAVRKISKIATSISDVDVAGASVWMNGDNMTITNNSALNNINIYSINGALVMSQPATNNAIETISLKNLNSGAYFVKVGNVSKKFIK